MGDSLYLQEPVWPCGTSQWFNSHWNVSDCYQQPGDSQFNNMVNGYYILMYSSTWCLYIDTLLNNKRLRFSLQMFSLTCAADVACFLPKSNHLLRLVLTLVFLKGKKGTAIVYFVFRFMTMTREIDSCVFYI